MTNIIFLQSLNTGLYLKGALRKCTINYLLCSQSIIKKVIKKEYFFKQSNNNTKASTDTRNMIQSASPSDEVTEEELDDMIENISSLFKNVKLQNSNYYEKDEDLYHSSISNDENNSKASVMSKPESEFDMLREIEDYIAEPNSLDLEDESIFFPDEFYIKLGSDTLNNQKNQAIKLEELELPVTQETAKIDSLKSEAPEQSASEGSKATKAPQREIEAQVIQPDNSNSIDNGFSKFDESKINSNYLGMFS